MWKRLGVGSACVASAMLFHTGPAAGVGQNARITKDGLGAIKIGMTLSQARAANGDRLTDYSNAAGDGSCATARFGSNVSGLFTEGVLARIYVYTSRYSTRKGVHVRDHERDVFRAYRQVRRERHAYVRGGSYLFVRFGNRRIVFETNARGTITSVSTGRIPEVTYIEGCA